MGFLQVGQVGRIVGAGGVVQCVDYGVKGLIVVVGVGGVVVGTTDGAGGVVKSAGNGVGFRVVGRNVGAGRVFLVLDLIVGAEVEWVVVGSDVGAGEKANVSIDVVFCVDS